MMRHQKMLASLCPNTQDKTKINWNYIYQFSHFFHPLFDFFHSWSAILVGQCHEGQHKTNREEDHKDVGSTSTESFPADGWEYRVGKLEKEKEQSQIVGHQFSHFFHPLFDFFHSWSAILVGQCHEGQHKTNREEDHKDVGSTSTESFPVHFSRAITGLFQLENKKRHAPIGIDASKNSFDLLRTGRKAWLTSRTLREAKVEIFCM